jgi:hypothetical protein
MKRLALALALILTPQLAHAYARTRNSAGRAAYWANPRVVMRVPALTADKPIGALTTENVLAASTAATDLWSRAQVDCTRAELSTTGGAPREALIGHDQQNNVIFRDDSWEPKTFDKNGVPIGDYTANQLALTSVFLRGSGEIVDADIEVNVFNHPQWEVSGDMSHLASTGAIDLQNTLSHEVGHVLGFDHSCWDPLTGPQPLDGDKPLTPCASDPKLAEATMAPTAPPGDVSKRVLHEDDRNAVCDVYPPTTPDGGCAIGGGPTRSGTLATSGMLTALSALALLRRRRGAAPRVCWAPWSYSRGSARGGEQAWHQPLRPLRSHSASPK